MLPVSLSAANHQLLGWNNLGMHCMDSDYSVFSILPPYNTIEAQLIVGGRWITNGAGYTVTYQAVADPEGSFNSTAMGKGNFYEFATGTVAVANGPYSIAGSALVPSDYPAGWPTPFTAIATPSNTLASVTYEWSVGDGSPLSTNRHATHTYNAPGTFDWSLTVRAGAASAGAGGIIEIQAPLRLGISPTPIGASISWLRSSADAVLKQAALLASPASWNAATNVVSVTPLLFEADVPTSQASSFFRLRQVQ